MIVFYGQSNAVGVGRRSLLQRIGDRLAALVRDWRDGWAFGLVDEDEDTPPRGGLVAAQSTAAAPAIVQGARDTPASAVYWVIDGPRGRVLAEDCATIARYADAESADAAARALAARAAPALFRVSRVVEEIACGYGGLVCPGGAMSVLALDPARLAELLPVADEPEPEPVPVPVAPSPADALAEA